MKESTKTATKVAKNETKATAKATETATAKNQVKEVKELKEDKAMQEVKEVKENKEMKENVTATTETTTSKTSKEDKEMNDTKELEQQLKELEDKKNALKEQLNEQKRVQRLEAQVKDKVVNLLERFAQIGVQLVANAEAIFEGTNDENLRVLSSGVTESIGWLNETFETFDINLQELKDNVKPLATAKTERTQRPHRTLSELGVKDGATVVHISTGNEYIVSNDKILYNDKETSLSKVASILKNGQSRSGFRDFRLKDCSECLADMPSLI